MLQIKNLPKVLQPVIDKWVLQKTEFYLGPENIYFYNDQKLRYLSNNDISTEYGSWYVAFGNVENKNLNLKQIQDIAMELAKYHRTNRWNIVLDYHCNYECKMCPYHGNGYIGGEEFFENRETLYNVVSREKAFDIIDILSENNIKILSIQSLGEIFLYPYWIDVAKYASKKGMELWTITNGSLLDEEKCKLLKEIGFTNIKVSLDAYYFETYSKIRSSKKEYFESAYKAPILLKKYGMNVNVDLVRQQENINEVNIFLDYWKNTDVDSISISNMLIYDENGCNSYFEAENDEFIHGICNNFGHYMLFNDGKVYCCCGIISADDKKIGLPDMNFYEIEYKDILKKSIKLISTLDSPLKNVCDKCPFYFLFSTEEIVGNWNVVKNTARETWTKIMTNC